MKIRPKIPIVKAPSVLVLMEKHESRYFYIPDEETLFRVSLMIVLEREQTGMYEPYMEKPEELDFTEESLIGLSESLQRDARAKLQKYKDNHRCWQQYEAEISFIKKTIEERNGENAYKILRIRRDGEYEGFCLERFEEIN